MSQAHEIGRDAEAIAARSLTRRGWQIEHRNWRAGHRELDLVARKGAVVAFVEVRARSRRSPVSPLGSITGAKRRDVRIAAESWIRRHGRPGEVYRFDAIAVIRDPAADCATVEHIGDAWRDP
jgi:putative endonuclease